MTKVQKKQNEIYRKMRPMDKNEEIEFYRNLSAEQKVNITFLFMKFGHKLKQKENPKVVLNPYD